MGEFLLLTAFFILSSATAAPFALILHRNYIEKLEEVKKLEGKEEPPHFFSPPHPEMAEEGRPTQEQGLGKNHWN